MSGEVCKFFLQGKCRFGSRCRNLHPRDSPGRGYGGGGGGGGQNNRYSSSQGFNQRRENRFELFNSWQSGGGRGRGYGQGQQRYDSDSYRQPRAGGYSSQQSRGPVEPTSPEEIVQVIREDMEMWAESQMWPFSCYSCQREGSCVPGLSDVSPEELRWQFHLEKMTTGGMAAYLETLQKLQDQLLRVRRELVNIHTSDVSALLSSSSNSSSGTGSLFGAVPSSPKPLFSSPHTPTSLFEAPQAGSFGSINKSGPSQITFTGSPTRNLFGGSPTGNLFGGLPTGSTLGSPLSGNLFGGSQPKNLLGTPTAQLPLQAGTPVTTIQRPGVLSPPASVAHVPPAPPPPTSTAVPASSQLTQDELNAFKSDHFVLGQIPETPPPPELI